MSVDFYPCNHCKRVFTDCSDSHVRCRDACERKWCSIDCALEDGFDFGSNPEDIQSCSCSFCRDEDANDSDLLNFLMKKYTLTREDVLKMYFEERKE
jgi:hypothetical protein